MATKPKVDMEALAEQVDPAKVAVVINLCRDMYRLEREIDQDLIALKEKQQQLAKMQMETLPEAMTAANMTEYQLGVSGYGIVMSDFVRASIPSQSAINEASGPDKEALINRRNAALAWLRNNKADSLIKNKLTAQFGKGQDKAAKQWAEKIEKAGYPAECEESVNFQTLNKFIKEQLENGAQVPTDTFALFIGKRAELVRLKKKG